MHKAISMRLAMVAILVAMMMVSGCVRTDNDVVEPGETQTEAKDIEQGAATAVEVYIEQGSGHLEVEPGASKLMEAIFKFNVEQWRPAVTYKDEGDAWNLSVIQPEQDLRIGSGAKNEWDIKLGVDVPKELGINLGAGDADVKASGLNLMDLWITAGAGQIDLDLTGTWDEDLTIDLNAGAGDIEIRVPSNVGVKLKAIAGVGDVTANGFTKSGNEYTNDAYDTADVKITITANAGVGHIIITQI